MTRGASQLMLFRSEETLWPLFSKKTKQQSIRLSYIIIFWNPVRKHRQCSNTSAACWTGAEISALSGARKTGSSNSWRAAFKYAWSSTNLRLWPANCSRQRLIMDKSEQSSWQGLKNVGGDLTSGHVKSMSSDSRAQRTAMATSCMFRHTAFCFTHVAILKHPTAASLMISKPCEAQSGGFSAAACPASMATASRFGNIMTSNKYGYRRQATWRPKIDSKLHASWLQPSLKRNFRFPAVKLFQALASQPKNDNWKLLAHAFFSNCHAFLFWKVLLGEELSPRRLAALGKTWRKSNFISSTQNQTHWMGQSATRGVHGKGELVHHGNDSSDSSSFAEFCSSFCLFFFLGGSDSSPALPPVIGKPAKLLYGTSCTRETEGNFTCQQSWETDSDWQFWFWSMLM